MGIDYSVVDILSTPRWMIFPKIPVRGHAEIAKGAETRIDSWSPSGLFAIAVFDSRMELRAAVSCRWVNDKKMSLYHRPDTGPNQALIP